MGRLRLQQANAGDLLVAEWDDEVEETVTEARSCFAREMAGRGRMAFAISGPGDHRMIREFDVEAEDILIVPAITGGAGEVPGAFGTITRMKARHGAEVGAYLRALSEVEALNSGIAAVLRDGAMPAEVKLSEVDALVQRIALVVAEQLPG